MMKRIIYVMLIIGAMVIGSCSSKKDVERLPGIDVPVNEMNSNIVLEPDPGMAQVHTSGEALGFYIQNRSSSSIYFGQDFGIKLFKKQGTDWKLVDNKWRYPEGENILPTHSEDPTGLALFVFPDMEGIKESTDVRIVVTGHVKDKPAEQVAAFYDVLYKP